MRVIGAPMRNVRKGVSQMSSAKEKRVVKLSPDEKIPRRRSPRERQSTVEC
jgi:hypothetical protein